MILLIDNYDSFTYNIYQMLADKDQVIVIRNDEKTVEEIIEMKPDAVVLSPGPGRPENAGVCIDVVQKLAGKLPILGVCLGHQAICQSFGGIVTHAKHLMHGKSSEIIVDPKSTIFYGLSDRLLVGRYHSLAVKREGLPKELKVTAYSTDGEVMGVEHQRFPIYGLQFHPESILTPDGSKMLQNFLNVG
ncbi:aminodeoxychorismate/anthranilate synthase component II [Blautia liquoris]|uniref:Aminodeoxychorismate/anthranilate synthase component II n=1 Tax=Blautia liquoris TaxID=2779518 RepID=A0A7M2RJX7_9FIRM|nr:aminodeoxychorismate/anthranilate synthase component II [Blautia liquoris]QOV20361.1 aminodeoxychorismate/anthranilate synthase component II [Blautia liquoris]